MDKRSLAWLGFAVSVFLFSVKLAAFIWSHSTAVLSDALNSCLDVISYGLVGVSVRLQEVGPDDNHHFGHRRAEPLAGLLVAVLATILGASIVRDALGGLTEQHPVHVVPVAIAVLWAAIASKAVLVTCYAISLRRHYSPALQASLVDSRNDILSSVIALLGYTSGGAWDDLAGLVIGAWIIWSGLQMGWPNLHFLMGAAPSATILARLAREARAIPGVGGVHGLRAHFVGDRLHVEIHIEVNGRLPLTAAHAIGLTVKRRLEQLAGVQWVFVHLDPR